MASLQQRAGTYRVIFRFHGKQHFVMIGKVSPQEAEAKSAQVEYLLMRLKQGLIELPPGIDIVEFVQHDGKPPAPATPVSASRKTLTLATLRDRYLATRARGREKNTLYTDRIHFNHLVATLGEKFPLEGLGQADLQRHVERRANLDISPVTIKKEITTLRTAWHWAAQTGLLSGDYPNKGLIYPKGDELPPYQTREEIERQVAAGNLTPEEIEELWDALYLRPHEIAELLEHVRSHARHPWIYPLACMAGHTGARRSELIRMQVADVDFAGGSVTIREKKRVKGKRSTRRAPLTPLLEGCTHGMACRPSRRADALLPVGPGSSQQEAEPHDRPPERQGPGDDTKGPHGDREATGGSPRPGAAYRRGMPRPFQADAGRFQVGGGSRPAHAPAFRRFLPCRGWRRSTDHRRHAWPSSRKRCGGDTAT